MNGKIDRPIRVLHVRTVNGTGGGPDKTVFKSCHYLTTNDHIAEAFYMIDRRNDTGTLKVMADDLGVRLHAAYENGPVCLKTVRRLDRVLDAGRYDIVHTHEYKSLAISRLMRARHSYKIVASAHGYNGTTRRENMYYALDRVMLRYVDAAITPTREMYDRLRRFGLGRDRLHIIPNGIDVADRITPKRTASTGTTHLLFLGRLSIEKDPANLLRATAAMLKDDFDVKLTIAGDGPERDALGRLSTQLGLNGRVQMLGLVSDVMPLLARADILVLPSRTECMPNALLEAMSAGVPVVATNVGGVRELIRNGIDGLLCPADNPFALARAVQRLIADTDLAETLAYSAYQRVTTDFSFTRHMQRTLEVYSDVLTRHA